MTGNDKYSCYKGENFPQEIQMQFSRKPKTFYQFSIAFVESLSNFQRFEKEDKTQSSSISEIIDSNISGISMF